MKNGKYNQSEAIMFNFNPRSNTYHQWAMVAFISIINAVVAAAFLPTHFGVPLALIYLIAFMQFAHAAATRANPWQEPFLVRRYEDTKLWWWNFSMPVMFMKTFTNKMKLTRPVGWCFLQIFDEAGYLIGTEQEIDWNYCNADPDYDSHDCIEIIESPAKKPYRLSWLARWRSREAFAQAKQWQNQAKKVA